MWEVEEDTIFVWEKTPQEHCTAQSEGHVTAGFLTEENHFPVIALFWRKTRPPPPRTTAGYVISFSPYAIPFYSLGINFAWRLGSTCRADAATRGVFTPPLADTALFEAPFQPDGCVWRSCHPVASLLPPRLTICAARWRVRGLNS